MNTLTLIHYLINWPSLSMTNLSLMNLKMYNICIDVHFEMQFEYFN